MSVLIAIVAGLFAAAIVLSALAGGIVMVEIFLERRRDKEGRQ